MPSHPKILYHRAALSNVVKRCAVEAGALILEYFDGIKDLGESAKIDGSPVTLADQEAEKLIEARLREVVPDIPVIGEESFESGRRINFDEHEYFWLVDPLDGTRAFVSGDGDFTVNIALIHKKQPIMGVIYAPESGELYAGFVEDDGVGDATRYFEDSEKEKPLKTRQMPNEGLTIMASNYSEEPSAQQKMLENFKVRKIIRRSSSIKLCAIANGKADIYIRSGPTCEWDTAAGHAILRASGGDIRDLSGQPLTYGGADEKLLNPHFIAASNDFFACADFG